MRSKSLLVLTGMTALLAITQMSFGHPGHGSGGGMAAGVMHPFTGIDHLLVMIGVGLLAAQRGGRAIWMLPVAFLGCMAAGGLAALAGLQLPMVEQGIMASVLLIGLVIAAAVRMPLSSLAVLVGAFAMFHGYAHLSEAGGSAAAFGVGMLIATGALHGVGIGLGLLAKRASRVCLRVAGAGVAAAGVLLIIHVI